MSPELRRVLALAVELAANPPARKGEAQIWTRVPWQLVAELRAALSDAGLDWQSVHAELHRRLELRAKPVSTPERNQRSS